MKTNTLYQRDFTGICPGHGPEKERKERKKLRGHSPLLVCILANPVWKMVDNLCMRFERFVNCPQQTRRQGPGQSRSESLPQFVP
jgi:hypothetical protein